MECVAAGCSVLQCDVACCSVLERFAECFEIHAQLLVRSSSVSRLELLHIECVPACFSVLQCAAARYSVLQRVAVCCSVLQCVAEFLRFLRSFGLEQ